MPLKLELHDIPHKEGENEYKKTWIAKTNEKCGICKGELGKWAWIIDGKEAVCEKHQRIVKIEGDGEETLPKVRFKIAILARIVSW